MTDENQNMDGLPGDDEDENQHNSDDLPDSTDTSFQELLKEALKRQQSGNAKPPSKKGVNFRGFREQSGTPWLELVGDIESFPLRVKEIVRQSVMLPRHDFQVPIVAAYLMTPSALCNQIPILYCAGQSGSGKSTIGLIASALHGLQPIGAGSTFASIRNTIGASRRYDLTLPLSEEGNEKNTCIVWEDISPHDLLSEGNQTFALLKNGVTRSGTIQIAELGGTNVSFNVFCPKIISSIHHLYAKHQLRELVRRVLVIQHKHFDYWLAEDRVECDTLPDADELPDITTIDFTGFQSSFESYWSDHAVLNQWAKTARSLSSSRPKAFPANQWKMLKDVMCAGIVTGIWASREDAIESMLRYTRWHVANIESQASATQKALSRFIEERTTAQKEQNAEFVKSGMQRYVTPLEISAYDLKKHVELLKAQGELDTNSNVSDVNMAMNNIGWELKPSPSGHGNTWQPITG